MRCLTDFFILIAVLAGMTQCSNSTDSTRPTNPTPSLWAGVRKTIDDLDANRSSFAEWKLAADSSEEVGHLAALRSVLVTAKVTSGEQSRAIRAFSNSPRTVHFGFECNYHALVFFDDKDQAQLVLKW